MSLDPKLRISGGDVVSSRGNKLTRVNYAKQGISCRDYNLTLLAKMSRIPAATLRRFFHQQLLMYNMLWKSNDPWNAVFYSTSSLYLCFIRMGRKVYPANVYFVVNLEHLSTNNVCCVRFICFGRYIFIIVQFYLFMQACMYVQISMNPSHSANPRP